MKINIKLLAASILTGLVVSFVIVGSIYLICLGIRWHFWYTFYTPLAILCSYAAYKILGEE